MKKKILTALALVSAFLMPINAYSMSRLGSVQMINAVRVEHGLSPLEVSETLANCSEVRASECEKAWSHTRPDGTEWYTVDGMSYGENLAKGFAEDSEMFDAWMNSEAHRNNILNPNFTTVYIADNGSGYVACEFGVERR